MSQCQIVCCDILLEFLQVAFHNVLYARKLYPPEIFVRKKIYGTSVHVSEHPEVNEYINNILEAVRELISHDQTNIKSINLVFHGHDKIPIEKFVFDLWHIQANALEKDPYFLKTEEALRTLCLKLSMNQAYLKPLPEGCCFTIEIETREAAHIALSENPKCEDFPWIVQESSPIQSNDLLPLMSINTEILGLQLFVLNNHVDL